MLPELSLPDHHREFLARFVSACQSDERVLAAFLSGSYAKDTADAYSDLDLDVIISDEAYAAFCAEKSSFIRRLGEPVFLEDFGIPQLLFFILSDDIEGELAFGCPSRLDLPHRGLYRILLDPTGLLTGVVFPYDQADRTEQIALLRSLIDVFWHDVAHFITAMGRGQLWWAYGQLETLRRMCVQLARLRHDFADGEVQDDPYFKIDTVLPIEPLAPLVSTFCPMEPRAMLRAVQSMIRFYQENVPLLAQAQGIPYPFDLQRVMLLRLERLYGEHLA